MRPIVMKFGGSSLATIQHVQRAAQSVRKRCDEGEQVVVVVSAMGKTTDHLYTDVAHLQADAHDCSNHAAFVLAAGEQISSGLFAVALEALGIRAKPLLAHQVPIRVKSRQESVPVVTPDAIQALLQAGVTPVIAGFQGVDYGGDIHTLGRGGSDTTAVAVASAIGARHCEILTDVDGVFDRDPHSDSEAIPFGGDAIAYTRLSHQEMCVLSRGGAHVVQPAAAQLAAEKNVVLRVAHTLSPDKNSGTWVASRPHPLGCYPFKSRGLPQIRFTITNRLSTGEDHVSSAK